MWGLSVFLLSTIMAREIELFRSIHRYNRAKGILPRHSTREWAFNAINLFFLIGFVQMSIGSGSCSLFQAKSTIEYGACFYAYTTESSETTHYLIQMWQINRIPQWKEHYQVFIEKSNHCELHRDGHRTKLGISFGITFSHSIFISFGRVNNRKNTNN